MKHYQIILIIYFLFSCSDSTSEITDLKPNTPFTWKSSSPSAQGMNEKLLNNCYNELRHLPYIGSVLIIKNGFIIKERYFNNYNKDYNFNIKSSSKGFTSALIGIAIEKGYIKSVDEKIEQYFPQYINENSDSRLRSVRVKDLLTMRGGFKSNEQDVSTYFTSNWVKSILNIPMAHAPGTVYTYDSKMTHLLSAIIAKSTGKSTLNFAEEHLFKPLNIKIKDWSKDPSGIYEGGSEMFMTSRDLSKLGFLYLKNGSINSNRVIGSDWISESLKNYANEDLSGYSPEVIGYGYSWWLEKINGYKVFSAKGYAGQFVTVVPALDLIITTTTDWKYISKYQVDPSGKFINKFISEYIIPAVIKETTN